MKILDGSRVLNDVEIHLTDTEAARLIDELASLRADIGEPMRMNVSHGWIISDAQIAEVRVFVHATTDELEVEVLDRTSSPS